MCRVGNFACTSRDGGGCRAITRKARCAVALWNGEVYDLADGCSSKTREGGGCRAVTRKAQGDTVGEHRRWLDGWCLTFTSRDGGGCRAITRKARDVCGASVQPRPTSSNLFFDRLDGYSPRLAWLTAIRPTSSNLSRTYTCACVRATVVFRFFVNLFTKNGWTVGRGWTKPAGSRLSAVQPVLDFGV